MSSQNTTLPPGDFGEVLGLLRFVVHRTPNGEIHISYREDRDLRPYLPQLEKWIPSESYDPQ